MTGLKNRTLLLFLLASSLACHSQAHIEDAEKKLLGIFQAEQKILENYQNRSYTDYMAYQVSQFKKKQKKISPLIRQVNQNFEALPQHENEAYQKKWQKEFQPTVDKIYALTRNLITRETADLTPEKMARIQELSLKMQHLEKETPESRLVPVFFASPTLP